VLQSGAAVQQWLDGRELARRLDAHASGRSDEGHTLWAAWVLERWLREERR
jgi:hypothetical protein